MEKEEGSSNQDAPSLHNTIKAEEDQSQVVRGKVAQGGTIASSSGGGGDRLKRDEWSEGAVSSLLDAYESKWVLRNRAKLKGHDWEDVARYVSSRSNSTKSPKTQTQCKNKIESMKKRYRSESAADASSSWPLFHRLDLLLRCRSSNNNNPSPPNTTAIITTSNSPIAILDQPPVLVQPATPPAPHMPPPPPPPPPPLPHQNSHESNGVELPSKEIMQESGVGTKGLEDHESDRMISMDMDSSTPMSETVKDKMMKSKEKKVERINKRSRKKVRRRRDNEDLAGSIRWLAEVMARAEQARLEMIKEVEKMRVEAEAKRGEMDLKRTEIIANTQLQIAQILAGNNANNKSIDSALRIGRN